MNEQYGSLDQNNKLICNYQDRCHHALLLLAVGITQPCHGDSDIFGNKSPFRTGAEILPEASAVSRTA